MAKLGEAREPGMDMTPVIDISFPLIVFFLCLPPRSLAAKLEAALPTTRGIWPHLLDPAAEARIDVRVVRGADGFVYQCGDSRTADVAEVERWIARLRDGAGAAGAKRVVGQVGADARAPHKYVIAAVNAFAAQNVAEVRFEGAGPPSEAERRARPLPPPR